MERIVLFNVDRQDVIRKIASNLKIKVLSYNICASDCTLSEFVYGKAELSGPPNNNIGSGDGKSLILMCELTDKHVDKVLAKMRENKVDVDYKAVLTGSNADWSLSKMMIHMEMEKNLSYK